MNRHVSWNCPEGCSHRLTRFEAKQLHPLSDAARNERLHTGKTAEGEQAPKKKPPVRRRSIGQFAHVRG